MQIFNFVVLYVIISHNVPTPHISETHLPIVSLNVSDFESWIDAQKSEISLYVKDGSLPRHPHHPKV